MSRAEIVQTTEFPARWSVGAAKLPICPLVGEMSGRTEGALFHKLIRS